MARIEQRRRADGDLTARVGGPAAVVTLPVIGRHSASARMRRTSRVRTVSSGWSRPLVSDGQMAG
jgi:hypothetical protein